MIITALLSFFDDDPALLSRAVSSAIASGATRVLAVDGPYVDFPHSYTRSRSETCAAIMSVPYTIVSTGLEWPTETAKRSFMLATALSQTSSPSWLMILDSDYEWVANPLFLRASLEETWSSVAIVSYTENPGPDAIYSSARMLLRADPGLKMANNHYTYLHPFGGRSDILCRDSTERALDLQGVARVNHYNRERLQERQDRQNAYYEIRDGQGLET